MTNRISDEIIKLLVEGKTSTDIINKGYKRGTVYTTQRKWRQGKVKTHPGDNNSTLTGAVFTPQTASTEPDIESDPEIVQLKKEIRKAELQKQLGTAKAPSEMEILIVAAIEAGQARQEECRYEENGLCTLCQWSSRDKVPQGIGELVMECKDTWRIKPSPLYCAMCTVSLEAADEGLQENLAKIPLLDIRYRFTCECGTKGMLSFYIKCTSCGEETWLGWWPKEQ